ncbi:MAG TPA: hypothetical protein VIO62_15875 [Candidatus Dormibacteraeota bacterium]|jgi:hypothetical protein
MTDQAPSSAPVEAFLNGLQALSTDEWRLVQAETPPGDALEAIRELRARSEARSDKSRAADLAELESTLASTFFDSVEGRKFDQRSKEYAAAQEKLAAAGDPTEDEKEAVATARRLALAGAVDWEMGTPEDAAQAAEATMLALLRRHLLVPAEVESLYEPFASVIPLASLE